MRWTAGFAAYHKRRSSLTCWICSGSDVPLWPKFTTPKKCIGSNARHDSLVDAMKNVDHHVFPTQPRSFHPHRHLFPLLTQFMRPRLVCPDCYTVGGSCVHKVLNPCAGHAKPAHVVVRVVSGDLEHLAPTLRQHLHLLGLGATPPHLAKTTSSQHHIHAPQEHLPAGVPRCACQLSLADHREDEPLHLVVVPKPNKLFQHTTYSEFWCENYPPSPCSTTSTIFEGVAAECPRGQRC